MKNSKTDILDKYMDVVSSMFIVLNKRGRIVFVNKAARETLGIPYKNIVGSKWLDFIPGNQKKAVDKVFGDIMSGKLESREVYENDIVTPSGEKKRILWHNALIRGKNGGIKNSVSSGRDVTALRRAEQDRRKLAADIIRQERLAALGRIAAGAAHEINNPLTGIMAFSDLLLADKHKTPAEIRKTIKTVKDSSLHIKKIISALLNFSETADSTEKMEKTDINKLIRNAINGFSERFKKNKTEVSFLQGKLPPVYVAKAGLFRSLDVIFENSIDALKEKKGGGFKGLVKIKTMFLPGTSETLISIRDNGSGIEENMLPKIFEPFFTTKQAAGNTGMGLASAYGTISAMGGKLEAESQRGKYTEFRIIIPAGDSRKGDMK
ncbi:MAG: ATP-binding protein [Elusimicrobiota bacterium]|nr:ATP-binding protein [Elusimicrobiota bacterium]